MFCWVLRIQKQYRRRDALVLRSEESRRYSIADAMLWFLEQLTLVIDARPAADCEIELYPNQVLFSKVHVCVVLDFEFLSVSSSRFGP